MFKHLKQASLKKQIVCLGLAAATVVPLAVACADSGGSAASPATTAPAVTTTIQPTTTAPPTTEPSTTTSAALTADEQVRAFAAGVGLTADQAQALIDGSHAACAELTLGVTPDTIEAQMNISDDATWQLAQKIIDIECPGMLP